MLVTVLDRWNIVTLHCDPGPLVRPLWCRFFLGWCSVREYWFGSGYLVWDGWFLGWDGMGWGGDEGLFSFLLFGVLCKLFLEVWIVMNGAVVLLTCILLVFCVGSE